MSESTLNFITIFSAAIVVIAGVIAYLYVRNIKDSNSLIAKRRWIESLPTLISSLGVLGTFAGITIGLVYFDPNNLDESIPKLLGGLKTAFFTSLAGMLGSMILSRKVSSAYDATDNGVSDINQAAGMIAQSVGSMQQANTTQLNQATSQLQSLIDAQTSFFDFLTQSQQTQANTLAQLAEDQRNFFQDMKALSQYQSNTLVNVATAQTEHFEKVENKQAEQSDSLSSLLSIQTSHFTESEQNMREQFASITGMATVLGLMSTALTSVDSETQTTKQMLDEQLTGIFNALENRLESITISVGNVEEAIAKQTEHVIAVDTNVSEIVESSAGTYGTQNDIIDEIKKLSPVIRDEVTEIEEKMTETNKLLTVKFDEFSDLLKKSNTEALVEVMRGVTLEFEKQMNALISKLIKENFEQLNESVGNMIKWQAENKDMITALTSKYNQMNTSFEETSTTLQKVETDTKLLVSDGSKLHTIIEGLELVLAKDKDFVATAKALRKAAEDNERNVEEYQKYTKDLNTWVEKQRNFSDAVSDLIKKLEQLDKLRDYNNEFWADAKRNLMEAQNRLHASADFLQGEIQTLDQHFYNRLSETLAQLDVCIQAMVKKNNN